MALNKILSMLYFKYSLFDNKHTISHQIMSDYNVLLYYDGYKKGIVAV